MIFVASLSPSFPVIYPTITSHRFILWKSYLLGSFSVKTNELFWHSPFYRRSISSQLPSLHRRYKTLRPWSRPDPWWPESTRTELWGCCPVMMEENTTRKQISSNKTNQEKVDIQIRINQIQCLSESLNIFSRLTISTGAILRTSCCSRVASQ